MTGSSANITNESEFKETVLSIRILTYLAFTAYGFVASWVLLRLLSFFA